MLIKGLKKFPDEYFLKYKEKPVKPKEYMKLKKKNCVSKREYQRRKHFFLTEIVEGMSK